MYSEIKLVHIKGVSSNLDASFICTKIIFYFFIRENSSRLYTLGATVIKGNKDVVVADASPKGPNEGVVHCLTLN